MAHRPQRQSGFRLRLADPFALFGAIGLTVLLVDRVASGTPADGNLAYVFGALILGAPVQRFAEGILDRRNGGA